MAGFLKHFWDPVKVSKNKNTVSVESRKIETNNGNFFIFAFCMFILRTHRFSLRTLDIFHEKPGYSVSKINRFFFCSIRKHLNSDNQKVQ